MRAAARARLLLAALLLLLLNMPRCGGAGGAEEGEEGDGVPPALACRVAAGLTREQRAACDAAPDVAALAFRGVRLAVAECAHQFRHHRWNCSSLAARPSNPHSTRLMHRGFRESAFAYALSAAGAAVAVARGCAAGRALACGCAATSAGAGAGSGSGWQWGGCSHDLQYALRYSARLLDAREGAGDLHSRVNLHNNNAGRLAVAANMEVRCKCHGMSGSCQLKTCWRATPELRAVGAALKRRYRSAVLLDRTGLNRASAARPPALRARRRPRTRARRPPPHTLLYYERSPSFCDPNPRLETAGTRGRVCRAGAAGGGGGGGGGGCGVMCCGRGHALVRSTRTAPCHCRFTWCCRVHCQQCRRDLWTAVCK